MKSQISQIKLLMWESLISFLENFKQEKEFQIINHEIGKKALEEMNRNPLISKYQWVADAGEVHNILPGYCNHFINNFLLYSINGIDKFSSESGFLKEFIESKQLKNHFNKQFELFEKEILLSKEFKYLILIPAFNIYFHEKEKFVIIDENHRIRNIYGVDQPYGNDPIVKKLKKKPRHWEPYEESEVYKEANACFEINCNIKKRLDSEPKYNNNFTPYAPLLPSDNNLFFEKVRSIPHFFYTFSPELRFLPFSLGLRFYIKLPPFSQIFSFSSGFIGFEFPRPAGSLNFKKKQIIKKWKKCWEDNYNYFFQTFYQTTEAPEKRRIFKYILQVISTTSNISYVDMRIFLLVSAFEGILFKDSIKKTLKVGGKSKPIAECFIRISRDTGYKWQFLVNNKYFELTKFDQESHDKELKDFIISAYGYRNNIAHPEKIGDLKFQPEFQYENLHESRKKNRLEQLIIEWFPKFLRVLVRIWVEKRFKDKDEWYNYLESLFK